MMLQGWRYINESLCSGLENMATDFAILNACNEKMAPPTIRLYGWETPTLSLGYGQKNLNGIDLDQCNKLKIPIVKRPTGGKALLHHKELTYSVVAPKNLPPFFGGMRGTYKVLSNWVKTCLHILGIEKIDEDARVLNHDDSISMSKSAACLATQTAFEISIHKKKIVGSAQRRMNWAFLQHGSVLIDLDRELLNSLLIFDDQEQRKNHFNRLVQRSTSLNEIMGEQLGFLDTKKGFYSGIMTGFFNGVKIGVLTPYEQELRDRFVFNADRFAEY